MLEFLKSIGNFNEEAWTFSIKHKDIDNLKLLLSTHISIKYYLGPYFNS